MKQITLDSPEFNRVLKNLQLENLSLSSELQNKVIEIINSKMIISESIIKDALKNVKIQ